MVEIDKNAVSEWVYECEANYSSQDGSPVIEIGYVST